MYATTLLLKLVITPALIGTATLAGRRFGPSFSGWLVGFPFTSAPVSLFLTAEQGAPFAAAAAVGSIGSVVAQAAFAVAYAAARGRGWPAAVAAGTIAFAALAGAIHALAPGALPAGALATLVLLGSLRLLGERRMVPTAGVAPRWDLPSRAVVATALVLALTAAAPVLGPLTSGLVSGFPLYATVLSVFAQRVDGPDAAFEVMRGLLAGLFGFAAFFLVIALALVPLGSGAFALATVAVIGTQAVSLALLRRERLR